ncbi:MAG: thioredoxin family protein [Planctomycetes bacterium]|nr:thioredoxin family protein [Planctomycetota bacterium]
MLRVLLVVVAVVALTAVLFQVLARESPALSDALARASREQRVVLVDYFTTWCAPCKRMDETTWKDPRVQAWLDTRGVLVRLDAERETELATRHGIDAYPTVLVLRADGTVVDRLVGFRDAKTLLADVEAALDGRDSVTRAKEASADKPNDPMRRGRYADELVRAGRHAEALAEYLWCFDHGNETPGYYGVRLSFLLSSIEELAEEYPPALDALRERRDAAEARLLAGADSDADVADALELNDRLGEPGRSLELVDRLLANGPLSAALKFQMLSRLVEPLGLAGRYRQLLALTDAPVAFVDYQLRTHAFLAKGPEAHEGRVNERLQRESVVAATLVYEALLDAGREAEARELVDTVLDRDASAATFALLVASAARVHSQTELDRLEQRARATLPAETIGEVERALRRGRDAQAGVGDDRR